MVDKNIYYPRSVSGGFVALGSFVAEVVFAWPGLGRITLEAIQTQDQYLVLGAVLMASTSPVAATSRTYSAASVSLIP